MHIIFICLLRDCFGEYSRTSSPYYGVGYIVHAIAHIAHDK